MVDHPKTPKRAKTPKREKRSVTPEVPEVPETSDVPDVPNPSKRAKSPKRIKHSEEPAVSEAKDDSGESLVFIEASEGDPDLDEPDEPDEPDGSSMSLEVSEGEPDSQDEADRLVDIAEIANRLEWRWASFELYVISPSIPGITPPVVIPPEPLDSGTGFEFVYPIHDYGFKLAASKADDMLTAGMSMCKLYYTIEKIIFLLIDRLKSGGISTDTEVQVSFAGFVLAQRKAFESIINLSYNVVVTNFEPGNWGEKYLQTIKRLADKGYGYPPGAPRDIFRHEAQGTGMRKKS